MEISFILIVVEMSAANKLKSHRWNPLSGNGAQFLPNLRD
jgi:hypothetical protein